MNAPRRPRAAPASNPLPTLGTLAVALATGSLGLATSGCRNPFAHSGEEPNALANTTSGLDITQWFAGPGSIGKPPAGQVTYVPPTTTGTTSTTGHGTTTTSTTAIPPPGAPPMVTTRPPVHARGMIRRVTPSTTPGTSTRRTRP